MNGHPSAPSHSVWRYLVLACIVFLPAVILGCLAPIAQDPAYLVFADRRTAFGIPNFFDVVSNVPFLFVGVAGLVAAAGPKFAGPRLEALVLFLGVSLVSVGSAHFHLEPTESTLIWDRLPITVGFMGLAAAVAADFLGDRIGRMLLLPLVLIGASSVAWWVVFEDLRFYAWVQFFPLLAIPFLIGLFRGRWSHKWILIAAIGLYVLAKITEIQDAAIFRGTGGFVSGHTIKHLLAAGSCLMILLMFRWRNPLGDFDTIESTTPPAA